MPDEFIEDLAKRLYERRHLAVFVPFEDRSSTAFAPVAKECHLNVDRWCLLNPTHRPIRGWVLFDTSAMGFFLFNAHSVVEDDTGRRIDVTPQRLLDPRPFLEDEGSNEEYLLMLAHRDVRSIRHPIR